LSFTGHHPNSKSEGISVRKTSYQPALSVISVAFLLCCTAICFAQNREKYVISAKAGGINAVTGQASVHAKGESDWQQLMVTDDLEAGDRVRTASDGRVEILLNPGSYLRVGGNSEVELSNNSLANLEVRLLRGTAIVEATGSDGMELMINISTPHTSLVIVRQGLYRLNVVPGDATELIVRKGRVILNDSHTKVKGGNKVVFSANTVSVAKLSNEEKKNKEEVEVWSKERAETLAKANRRINDRMLTSAFASYRDSDRSLFGGGLRSSGLWFFNSRAGCYTFLPFFYGWGSPYGSSYSTSIYTGVWNGGRVSNGATNNWPAPTTGGVFPGTSTGPANPGSPAGGINSGGVERGPARDINSGLPARKVQMSDPGRPN
jgi:FecR protein